jgi:two-component system nitrogen regulation sensor histidine kinase NtrY
MEGSSALKVAGKQPQDRPAGWRLRRRQLRRRLHRLLPQTDSSPRFELALAGFAAIVGSLAWMVLARERVPTAGSGSPPVETLLLVGTLIPLIALLVLIARRIALLLANRRAGVAGARLQVRLVALFATLAAVPTILVVVFASLMFQFGLQFWFSDRTRTVLANATEVAEVYVEENKSRLLDDIIPMAGDIGGYAQDFGFGTRLFREGLEFQVAARNLSEAAVFELGPGGARIVAQVGLDERPFALRMEELDLGQARVDRAQVVASAGDRVEAVVRLDAEAPRFIYVSRKVEPRVLEQVARTRSALSDYRDMTERSRELERQFNLTLIFVSLLTVAIAIWFALLLGSRLAAPIGALAAAAGRVGEGDLDARVAVPAARDEVSLLARAFNRMTGQIKAQQDALIGANAQSESRRRFIEAVLSGVSAGVLSIDQGGTIRLANSSAESLLDSAAGGLPGQPLARAAPELAELLDIARAEGLASGEVTRMRGSETQTLAVRLTAEPGQARNWILTFDDISAQVADQRRAAWSDVARRIAHEIKNPLTPIVLSAERLKRRFGPQIGEGRETYTGLLDTIIRQVDDLRRMVDEFSAFARMPRPTFRTERLEDVVRQAMLLAEVANPTISYSLSAPADLPDFVCDRRQIGQAITNLLKNAAEAIQSAGAGVAGRIDVSIERDGQRLALTVADTGCGLPEELRERLFEPYVTTRDRGTGLGLAIVKRIAEDHHGRLELVNRPEGGAVARLSFDLAQEGKAPLADAMPETGQTDAPAHEQSVTEA